MGRDARIRGMRRRDPNYKLRVASLPNGAQTYDSPIEVPAELRELLYAHEILRRAQYSARQLFVTVKDGNLMLVVEDAQTKKRAGLIIAETALDQQDLVRLWPGAVKLWNDTCNSDDRWNFEGSKIRQAAVGMISDLIVNQIRPEG